MAESDPFLVACMAYCLTWEVGGQRAGQYWDGIRDYVANESGLSDGEHKVARLRAEPVRLPPLASREADFRQFVESPLFIEGFRKYCHQPPKRRHNQQMRVLLCVAAALSQMVDCADAAELKEWSQRLGRMGSYTEQTCTDVADLGIAMFGESYDALEIGYRLFVDAKEADQQVIVAFCERYADELTSFARDLLRGMQLAG